ncbi:MAG: NIPSNAP family protein [Methylobacteriaceae bacterium]|nr:NIPSNAP family protein [Methylobacteriaceae bacterium]MBV9243824.1 NIPSNAP family protein [Methylobacteriaceae bacterium]MBV9635249.1 NIPSNAP family protein [Methylobacteriaceae bacterium]MBV9704192.1 NIPSNAP family protein [Methylobacteriaceae bacterium]
MITAIHTTRVVPHLFAPYLDAYEREGWTIEREILGDCAGSYFVEIGTLQRVVQLWRVAEVGEWTARRTRLADHPGWKTFRAAAADMILEEFGRLFRPAPFIPVKNLASAADFVEMRTYQSHTGVLEEFLRIYEAEGLPVQLGHLGNCVGYFRSLDGRVDEIVHLWGYADLNERTKRRAALFSDPKFKAFLVKGVPNFANQENMILRPTPFWRG